MTNLSNFYIYNVSDIIKIAVSLIAFFYIYYYIVFYLLKLPRPLLHYNKTIIFTIIIAGALVYIKYFNSSVNDYLFKNKIYYNIYGSFLKDFIDYSPPILILLAVILFIFRAYLFKSAFDKYFLEHGPNFKPSSAANGIPVGRFKYDILPDSIKPFVENKPSDVILDFSKISRTTTILGDMGSGKSRLMALLHDKLVKEYPDVPVLIHDPKGEWLRTFYDSDKDIIFSPYDERSFAWNLWEDIKNNPQLLFPVCSTAVESHHSGKSDRFWTDSAIALLKEILNTESLPHSKISLIEKKKINQGDKTFSSIYSSALIGYRDIASIESSVSRAYDKRLKVYTLKEILSHKGRIFLLNNPLCSAEQHGSLTLLLTLLLLYTISLPDVKSESELRLICFIDEALTFNLPADIEKAIFSQCRSKGVAIIVSAQRLPNEKQGERGAWSWQSNYLFSMRVSDLETRKNLSERIGNIRYDEMMKSISTGNKNSESSTESLIQRQHSAIPPEDFGKLKNREFYLIHENGIMPGATFDAIFNQKDIDILKYDKREDLIDFMSDL